MDPTSLKGHLRNQARRLGFEAFGVVRPDAIPLAAPRLARFLEQGRHGDMEWLARTPERRGAPAGLWPEVKSVILVGMNYGPELDPQRLNGEPERGVVSVYALGKDYHDVIKSRLKALARALVQACPSDVKVFVDTAPVMEKPLAEAAGVGWQGKHTNLVSRQFGSWLFLGALFTTTELPPDTPSADHCGQCRECLDVCPTAAFPAPYQLDARRCLSYLTIEHKGHIPREFRAPLGNRIYGCDDCLAVCPWNKFAQATRELAFAPRAELTAPRLAQLASLDDSGFRAMFAGSPIKRIGRDRFVRNATLALGNAGADAPAELLEHLAGDPSPLVRAAAIWALGRVAPARARLLKVTHAPRETDPEVAEEWQQVA